jgi:hypothetical protein
MNVNFDQTGKILAVGTEVIGTAVDDSLVPTDFLNTFALGKYVFTGGAITEVDGWVPPAQPAPVV